MPLILTKLHSSNPRVVDTGIKLCMGLALKHDGLECPICSEPVFDVPCSFWKGSEIKQLDCGCAQSLYHKSCIDDWRMCCKYKAEADATALRANGDIS